MTSALWKPALPYVPVLFLTLVSTTVSAQIDAGAAPAALSPSDFSFYLERFDAAQGAWVKLSATEQAFFFDRARCECAGDATNYTGSIKIAIESAPAAALKIRTLLAANPAGGGSARLYAGGNVVNCLDASGANANNLPAYCLNLLDPSSYTAGIPGGMTVFANQPIWESPPIPVAWLFNSTQAPVCGSAQACGATSACGTTRAAQTIYFWAQTSASGLADSTDLSFAVNLVGEVSYQPTSVTVAAANEALIVGWSWSPGISPPAADPSFLGVQIFCQRDEGQQAFSAGSFAPAFIASAAFCPMTAPAASTPLAFANLDPTYLCSGLLPATTTRYRISGLQNGIAYGVGVAAVDKYGNLGPIAQTDIVYNFPSASVPASDGGVDGDVVQGGGCALAGRHEPHGAWASLGLLALGGLLLARVRGRRR